MKPFLVEELTLLTQDESDSDSDNAPDVKNDSDIGPPVKNNLDNTPVKNDSNMVPPVKTDLDIKARVKTDLDVGPPDKLNSDIHKGTHVKIETDEIDAEIEPHVKNDSDHTLPVTNDSDNTSSVKNDTGMYICTCRNLKKADPHEVKKEMLFKYSSIFNSDSHFVKPSRTMFAFLKLGITSNIYVNSF